MTPAARLATAMVALDEIADARTPADVVVARFFRARRYVGSKDRAAIAATVYRILRSEARLAWWLERTGQATDTRGFVLADALLNDGVSLADLHNMCDGGQYAPERIHVREHDSLKQMNGQPLVHPDMPDNVRLECPSEMLEKLKLTYGDRYEAILLAMQHQAPLDVRVNSLKADVDTLFNEFKQVGFNVSRCEYAADGLRLHGRPNLNAHSAFKDGLVEIQDEGSQLIALVCDVKPGMRVLDFCAGAGGKTLALAAHMKNKGKIVATDTVASRLTRAKLRFRRADAQNIEVTTIKAENDPWFKRHKDEFDRVLVDAPCSGTGTWRRNPEMRWKQHSFGLDELVPMQARILASAARLVKPGGRLIYATCSLLPEENEAQIDAFLSANDGFERVPLPTLWPSVVANRECPVVGDYLRLDPATHETDGFFAAVLARKAG